MKIPKISVIIPVYNEESAISNCLQSLKDQQNTDFEVIIVDDGSSDSTQKIVSDFKPITYSIKLLKQNHMGPATARNYGAKNAQGEILVFVDADMTFDEDFIAKLTLPISRNKAIGTHCDKEYVSNWENVWARFWNYNQGIWSKSRHSDSRHQLIVFRAIKKSEFDKVRGFDVGGYTDDLSLVKKINQKPYPVRSTSFYHANPDNLREVYSQARWSAKREYKLGRVGAWLSLFKYSPPISIIVGIYKSLRVKSPLFIIFKLVYDAGIAMGIIDYKILGKGGSK